MPLPYILRDAIVLLTVKRVQKSHSCMSWSFLRWRNAGSQSSAVSISDTQPAGSSLFAAYSSLSYCPSSSCCLKYSHFLNDFVVSWLLLFLVSSPIFLPDLFKHSWTPLSWMIFFSLKFLTCFSIFSICYTLYSTCDSLRTTFPTYHFVILFSHHPFIFYCISSFLFPVWFL